MLPLHWFEDNIKNSNQFADELEQRAKEEFEKALATVARMRKYNAETQLRIDTARAAGLTHMPLEPKRKKDRK